MGMLTAFKHLHVLQNKSVFIPIICHLLAILGPQLLQNIIFICLIFIQSLKLIFYSYFQIINVLNMHQCGYIRGLNYFKVHSLVVITAHL